MLEFEHLIQINDPHQPQIPPLSRAQLWAGLLLRARHPGEFNDAIESRLEEVDATHFIRYLQIGAEELRDDVHLLEETEIVTRITHEGSLLHAESRTRIEEPEPGFLFVRFTYRRDSANVEGQLNVDEYLKSAYLLNDRDAIAQIRQMVSAGWPHGV